MRLNKYIASTGFCSRREADALIEKGLVTVNGAVAGTGMQIFENDEVTVDGKSVKMALPVMKVFYKPAGVVCSSSEKDRAMTVDRYLHLETRLFPVGRLDKDSEGLLLLTNMGDLSEQIARAGLSHEKEYLVTCKHVLSGAFIDRMRRGVTIRIPANRSTKGVDEVYTTRECTVERIDDYHFRIILCEGKNRQIRRMCETLGNKVTELKRVRIMNILLGDLREGECRDVTPEELERLRELL